MDEDNDGSHVDLDAEARALRNVAARRLELAIAAQAQIELVTVSGMASMLGVTTARVRQLIIEGVLPHPIRAGTKATVWTAEVAIAARDQLSIARSIGRVRAVGRRDGPGGI